MTRHKDGYEDILEDRRHSSDLKWACKTRQDIPQYKYRKPRKPADLKTHVLSSDRVRYAVETISTQEGCSKEDVLKEAEEILEEMGHNLNVTAVRGVAGVMIKVFKSIYSRIYVNDEGIQQLRKLVQEYPVILMPTHRSYMDFLLVSYVFFQYDLPLPAIAAAMDFKGMKFVGWLLKNCGAFYIRRSFGSDKLYWAIFTEYVQTQIRNGDNPLEFFVEGTRSRTAKSYVPKIGMLSASLESYFKAEVPDIMVVPISISYDRILEEGLYAYELLGIPKPKESTAGLLKARSILSDDYGNVHFHIGEAISIRQFSTGKVDRVFHALEPRYINSLTAEEEELTNHLAYNIVRQQQKHMIISPWSLIAAVLMQSGEGVPLRQLTKEVDWLKRQGANVGAYVDWPGNTSSESVVKHYLGQHTNVVAMDKDGQIRLKLVRPAHIKNQVKDEIMLNAATNLILASYRNQLLHIFVRVALVALSVNSCEQETMSMDELFTRYSFLERLLAKDFVFQPGDTNKDFDLAVMTLTHSGGLTLENGQVVIKKSINKHTTFFSQMFEPFLLTYWLLCQHLLSLTIDATGRPLAKQPKQIAKDAQQLSVRMLQEGALGRYEVLSLDVINNGLGTLVAFKAMHKDKRNDEAYLSPNHVAVSHIADEIAKYIELPPVSIHQFTSGKRGPVLSAKL